MIFFNFRAFSRAPTEISLSSTSDQMDSSPWRWWNLWHTHDNLIKEWTSSSPITVKRMLSGRPVSVASGARWIINYHKIGKKNYRSLPTTSRLGWHSPTFLLFGRGLSTTTRWNFALLGAERAAISYHTVGNWKLTLAPPSIVSCPDPTHRYARGGPSSKLRGLYARARCEMVASSTYVTPSHVHSISAILTYAS